MPCSLKAPAWISCISGRRKIRGSQSKPGKGDAVLLIGGNVGSFQSPMDILVDEVEFDFRLDHLLGLFLLFPVGDEPADITGVVSTEGFGNGRPKGALLGEIIHHLPPGYGLHDAPVPSDTEGQTQDDHTSAERSQHEISLSLITCKSKGFENFVPIATYETSQASCPLLRAAYRRTYFDEGKLGHKGGGVV